MTKHFFKDSRSLLATLALSTGCAGAVTGGLDGASLDGASTLDGAGGDGTGTSTDGSAPDPLNAPPTCTSGTSWTGGNTESVFMNPGQACIECHNRMFRAPRLTIAGTVFPSGHEPNNCNGGVGDPTSIVVEITDSVGTVLRLPANEVGNFFSRNAVVAPPYTAKILYQGRERRMIGSQTSTDCNSCHTQMGTNGAPGRVVVP